MVRKIMHSKKDVRRINDREDYEKSGFKGVMDDVDKDKEEALDSAPEIHKEQVPKNGDTTKELLLGDSGNDAGTNNHDTMLEENVNSKDKNKIISAKMSKFGKGFVIPDDKNSC
jgi:hypothetical protein